jgi:hypothetical protein
MLLGLDTVFEEEFDLTARQLNRMESKTTEQREHNYENRTPYVCCIYDHTLVVYTTQYVLESDSVSR